MNESESNRFINEIRRLRLAESDIAQVAAAAVTLAHDRLNGDVCRALETAIVVFYARPYNSRNKARSETRGLPEDEDARRVHDAILMRRPRSCSGSRSRPSYATTASALSRPGYTLRTTSCSRRGTERRPERHAHDPPHEQERRARQRRIPRIAALVRARAHHRPRARPRVGVAATRRRASVNHARRIAHPFDRARRADELRKRLESSRLAAAASTGTAAADT
jgi:hypothetical protein